MANGRKKYTQTEVDVKLMNEHLVDINDKLSQLNKKFDHHLEDADCRDDRIIKMEKFRERQTVINSILSFVAGILVLGGINLIFFGHV